MKTRMKPAAGLTLIELMVAISIGALLLTLGVPAMGRWISASRMTTAANDVLLAAHYGRTEAIKRRTPITVCIAKQADPATCVAGPTIDATEAWTVFVDADRDLEADTGTRPLRVIEVPPATIRLTLTPVPASSKIPFLSFGQDGFGIAAGDMNAAEAARFDSVVLCDRRGIGTDLTSAGQSPARLALVSASGRVAISRDTTQISQVLTAAGLDEKKCKP